MIHVIYGFLMGLGPTGNQTFDQSMDFAEDDAETDDQFGFALASGDFNGDGNFDVAIGIPYEDRRRRQSSNQCGCGARDLWE